MRQMTEEQQKKQQRYLERQIEKRWQWTLLYVFIIMTTFAMLYQKRSQWLHLFTRPIPPGKTILDSAWVNIAELALWSFVLVQLWLRVYNYRRELLLAEQMALQKAAQPPEGVWPPPPMR